MKKIGQNNFKFISKSCILTRFPVSPEFHSKENEEGHSTELLLIDCLFDLYNPIG